MGKNLKGEEIGKASAKASRSCEYQNNYGSVRSRNGRFFRSSCKTISAKRGLRIKIYANQCENGVKMA